MSFDDFETTLPSGDYAKTTAGRVSELTAKLSERASTLSERIGLRGPVFQVGGNENPKTIEEMFLSLTKPAQQFRITRVGDVWDVFYAETVTLSTIGKQEWQRISSCRWETKALFIKHAKEIFSIYFKHANEFIDKVQDDLTRGSAVLKELQDLINVEK